MGGAWERPWRLFFRDPEGQVFSATGYDPEDTRRRARERVDEIIAARARPRMERLVEMTSKYRGGEYPLAVEIGEVLRLIVEELAERR